MYPLVYSNGPYIPHRVTGCVRSIAYLSAWCRLQILLLLYSSTMLRFALIGCFSLPTESITTTAASCNSGRCISHFYFWILCVICSLFSSTVSSVPDSPFSCTQQYTQLLLIIYPVSRRVHVSRQSSYVYSLSCTAFAVDRVVHSKNVKTLTRVYTSEHSQQQSEPSMARKHRGDIQF